MLTSRHSLRSTLLVAAVFLVVACGGSSSPKAAAGDSQTDQQSSTSVQSESSDGGGAGSVPSGIVDATYQHGTAHVEISGEKDVELDFNGASGVTNAGNTAVNFHDASGTSSLTITQSDTEEAAGIAVTSSEVTTGGQFGENCKLELTKHDGSELAGSFTCTDVDGLAGATVFSNLDIKGTFSAKP